jgi:hypothetical protein
MDNQQNNREKKSVNTRNGNSTNGRAKVPTALEVSYWDDMVKLSFSPELPESLKTETKRYDYDNQWTTCIVRAKCNELVNAYTEIILPALNDNKQERVSITVANVNSIAIDTGVDLYNDGECHPFIEFVKNIDPETLKSNEKISYEFSKGDFIHGHNPVTGEFKERVITHNELYNFVKDLDTFRDAASKTYVHAARCVDRTWKDALTNNLQKIGEKVGADLSYHGNYRRDGMGYGSIFDKPAANTGATVDQHVISSMDELEESLPFN